ncbi:MAG: hypothetical protein EOO68_30110 [Moraxellaceae bacterium]|nr:MAG: hypothetical protein EOO68_30110 [Moraxellaceae bacterium]
MSPFTSNNSNCNGGGTVYVNTTDPNDPGNLGEGEGEGDGEGDGEGEGGEDGGGDDTGGQTTQFPPR